MSFISIPNQPILFHSQDEILTPCEECGESNYKQLIDFNDKVFFQLESTACTQYNMKPYDSSIDGWINTDGNICGDGSIGSYAQYLYIDYAYELYSITFTILSFEEGTLNIQMGGSTDYDITLAGTYTFYFNNVDTNDNSYVILLLQSSNFKGCFDSDSIKVKGIASKNEIKIGIVDAITLEQYDVIVPNYTIIENKIIGSFDFTNVDVSEGCYRLSLADFCENTCSQFRVLNNLFNLQFGNTYGWTAGGNNGVVTFTQNNTFFDVGIEESDAYIKSISSACTGKYYYVSLFVESRANAEIRVTIGENEAIFPSGTGYITAALFAGNPNLFGTQITILVNQAGLGGGYVNISRIEISIDDNWIQWNKYSDVFDLGDYNDSCKYFKIEGCNAQEQFNLAFNGNDFMPMIRLEGKRAKPQYVTNANAFRYSSGKWNANYVNRLKQWTYYFGRLPEYVLDFLSTIFYYDNCYVNKVLMFPQDNAFPTIDYSDADTYLGSFAIDLIEKENKVVKVQCSDSNATCLPSEIDIDEPFLLTQDDIIITTEDAVNLYYEN